jgi:murein tripeptide amidase MpaA
MRQLTSILFLLVLVASALAVSQKTLQGIHRYISAEKSSDSDLAQLSATGTMAGYFNYEDVWQIHSSLAKKFPQFVTQARSFGKTWHNEDMLTFKIGNSIKTDGKSTKFGILFNALHHAREQTSLTMLIMVLIENLRRIVHKDPMFNYVNIEFIPVVNVDSKRLIDKNWQTPNWPEAK